MNAPRSNSATIATRLLRSHLAVAFVGVAALAVILFVIFSLGESVDRAANVRKPTMLALARISQGVEHSDAAIHGWVAKCDEKDIAEHRLAWASEIHRGLNALQEVGAGDLRDELIIHTDALAVAQWWVKDVASTPGNEPAKTLRQTQVTPILAAIDRVSESIVEEVDDPRANVPSGLLVALLRFSSSFDSSVMNLDAFLAQGRTPDAEASRAEYATSFSYLTQLRSMSGSVDPAIRSKLDHLFQEAQAYNTVSKRAMAIRASDQWNIAYSVLAQEAEPVMADLRRLLGEQQKQQAVLWEADQKAAMGLMNVAVFVCALGLLTMILLGCFLSSNHAQNISNPIEQLAEAAKVFAADRRVLVPIKGSEIEEISVLTRALSSMQTQIREAHKADQKSLREAQEKSGIYLPQEPV